MNQQIDELTSAKEKAVNDFQLQIKIINEETAKHTSWLRNKIEKLKNEIDELQATIDTLNSKVDEQDKISEVQKKLITDKMI